MIKSKSSINSPKKRGNEGNQNDRLLLKKSTISAKESTTRPRIGRAEENRPSITVMIPADYQSLISDDALSSRKASDFGYEVNLTEEEFHYIQRKFYLHCDKCKCVKPPRAHHCSKCNRCVYRMDHHCTWVANCVGQRNLKFFLNFVSYLAIYLIYSVIIFTKDGIECVYAGNSERKNCQEYDKLNKGFWVNVIVTFFNGIMALLVSAFCIC